MTDSSRESEEWKLLNLLTRYVDGQLGTKEVETIESLIAENQALALLARQLTTSTQVVREAILTRPVASLETLESPGEDRANCLPDDALLRASENQLRPSERDMVEAHLSSCNHCLYRLVRDTRTCRQMARGRWPELPPALKERIASLHLVHEKEIVDSGEQSDIIRFSLASPGPQTRTLNDSDRGLRLTLVFASIKDGELAQIDLQLRGPRSLGAGYTITVQERETHKKVVSLKTGTGGEACIRRLPPGSYILHIEGSLLKPVLDLISEDEEEEGRE
ncbi:MAG: hypothetical protein ACYTGH_00360 [Planctomycetota bacterium]|jgi:hypothetical protein